MLSTGIFCGREIKEYLKTKQGHGGHSEGDIEPN